ncbi:hypothetical protein [Paramagnetospirillum caucaseum]|uniref:hypothetical protein n=1 Tax=Paramagnetospirillum caucaseum TaxID=1244869 RepID=UPI001377D372|nr:hypothetical protein [Paramagnetospirillum caucaseum]
MTTYQDMRQNLTDNMSLEDVKAYALNYLDIIEQVFAILADTTARNRAALDEYNEAMT